MKKLSIYLSIYPDTGVDGIEFLSGSRTGDN
jgi:hypothetical protein